MRVRKLNLGEVIADKYVIEGVVGQGDCRVVYHAIQLGIDTPAVVMTPVPSESPDDKSNHHRFEREVLDAARLRHPHAISILDAGHTKEGLPYVVTERLEGQTLAELLSQKKRLDPESAISILAEVLEAVGAAHELAIIHKDLTPSNIQVSDLRGKTHVKVTNFGIARVAAAQGAITGAIPPMALASKVFAAPEFIDGEPVGRHSDLYSIGLIAHLMLTGELPDSEAGTRATLPEAIAGTDLETVVERLLQPDIDERYSTASEALAALRPGKYGGLVAGQDSPPTPSPPEPVEFIEPASDLSEVAGPMTSPSPAVAATPHHGGHRGALLLVALVTVILLGVCVAVLAALSGGDEASTPVGDAEIAGEDAASPTQTAAPAAEDAGPGLVIVTIETRPGGAEILVDGESIGRTPFELETPPSARPLAVTFKRDGYRELPTSLSIKDDATIVFKLESVR